MKYAGLVIDNKSDKTDSLYTYGCSDDISLGQKVYVSFGKGKKLKAAYVFDIKENPPADIKNIKNIEEVDESVSLSEEMVRTCTWMRKRYMCRYIDGVELFTPVGSPLKSGKTRVPHSGNPGEVMEIDNLTEEQARAIEKINSKEGHGIFLIHGVTGSGKTEIYMQLIKEALDRGKTAVMMVPEISLTKQILDRFIGRFGHEKIALLHSKLSKGERYDEWMRIRRGEAPIVIGARSAVFAPLKNVGVFILDEEHESSYKSETKPRYDALEVAVKRAMDMDAKVVLGSATPSVVSYSRCREGLYELIELKERYNRTKLPAVEIVDMRKELKKGNTSVFSTRLVEEIQENLGAGKQVILFMNRRGYSTFVSCRECGHVLRCPECEISLTYHKAENMGVCHYCGRKEPIPNACPVCGSKYIKYFGTGTEKIEEEIGELFPDVKVDRLDLDSMSRKGSLERILRDFGSGKTRILTGTQVVAKGLDFKNVGLVGIVSADVSLNIPDYRSGERTFELITQAAGRAGRGDEEGRVIIQTYTPDNYAIMAAAKQDYEEFYSKEIVFRRARSYPPFGDFIQIIIGSGNKEVANALADEWEEALRRSLPGGESSVLPHYSMITTAKDGYKECIFIRCPKGGRKAYFEIIAGIREWSRRDRRSHSVVVDVNPYNMWRS